MNKIIDWALSYPEDRIDWSMVHRQTPADEAPRCKIRDLVVLAYAQGFTQWHYKSNTVLSDVTAPGFFDDALDILHPGDHVLISARDAGSNRYVRYSDLDRGVVLERMQ